MENSELRAFINHYFVRSIEKFKFEFYYGIIIKKFFIGDYMNKKYMAIMLAILAAALYAINIPLS